MRHYLPGFKSGGPPRTIAGMVERLAEDFAFRIVTSDRDATDRAPYPGIRPDRWSAVGGAEVLYLAPGRRNLAAAGRILRETPHDLLYLNSVFDPWFSALPLFARRLGLAPARPAVIAPRGEFAPGALALKRWKKRPFAAAARVAALHRGLVWQASSEAEAGDVRRALGRRAATVIVAPDLVGRPVPAAARAPEVERLAEEPLRVLFLARIAPMKNLDFALRALAHVKAPVRFEIHGPIRDARYWQVCKALIERLPPHVVANYRGAVETAEVPSVMAAADLLFLPTRGENFGHAILEALAAGTPVLVSNRTPWRGLGDEGVGWDLPLGDERAFTEAIDRAAAMAPGDRQAMRERARRFAFGRICDADAVEANRALFRRTLEQRASRQ